MKISLYPEAFELFLQALALGPGTRCPRSGGANRGGTLVWKVFEWVVFSGSNDGLTR